MLMLHSAAHSNAIWHLAIGMVAAVAAASIKEEASCAPVEPGNLPSQGELLPATFADEADLVTLLQKRADGNLSAAGREVARRKVPNATAVWEELAGIVHIDDLQENMSEEVDSNILEQERNQLKDLKSRFPEADAIKQKFANLWGKIRLGVHLEDFKQKLEEAKDSGSAGLEQIQKKFEDLQKEMPDKLDDIKDQAASTWSSLQDSLPDLDELMAIAHGVARKTKTKVHDAVKGAIHSIRGWFR